MFNWSRSWPWINDSFSSRKLLMEDRLKEHDTRKDTPAVRHRKACKVNEFGERLPHAKPGSPLSGVSKKNIPYNPAGRLTSNGEYKRLPRRDGPFGSPCRNDSVYTLVVVVVLSVCTRFYKIAEPTHVWWVLILISVVPVIILHQ